MAGQPSFRPLEPSEFFTDGRSARPLVSGTVARGHLQTDLALFTGRKTRRGRNPKLAALAATVVVLALTLAVVSSVFAIGIAAARNREYWPQSRLGPNPPTPTSH